jgi:hypothetical protein
MSSRPNRPQGFSSPFDAMEAFMMDAQRSMHEAHSRAFSMFNDPFFSAFQFPSFGPSFHHQSFPSLFPSSGIASDGARENTRIEELPPGEYQTNANGTSRQYQVQEPDDDHPHDHSREGRQVRPRQNQPQSYASPASYTFMSSTSFVSNGHDVVQQTTQARMGPGGVREYQSTFKDREKESVTIARGLGDGRAQEISRTRTRDGRETMNQNFRGMREDEADQFDRDWRSNASRALPGYTNGSRSMNDQRPQRPQAALPSSIDNQRSYRY